MTAADPPPPDDWLPTTFADYPRIPSRALAPLMRVRSATSAGAIVLDLVLIAGAIAAAVWMLPWWCYPLVALVVGARQQAMIVLMHEAAHRKLFRNPAVNDSVGEVVLAWPFFVSMFSYRANHFAHHRHLNTELDPDWVRYLGLNAEERKNWQYQRTLWQVVRPLAADLVGLGVVRQVKRVVRLARPRNHDPRRAGPAADTEAARKFRGYSPLALWGFRLGLAAGLTVTGTWWVFLLYWVVPGLTVLKMGTRLRLLAGHFAIYGGEGIRTTLTSPLGRLLLGPHNIGYHVEHHLYPAVYFGCLPELHRMLAGRGDYAGGFPLRVTRGYWQLLLDWTRDPEAQRASALGTPSADGPPPPNPVADPVWPHPMS
jgi:fatty acid desaturase